ncbi:glycosyltransferase [Agrococcus terreus]|uniref:glycosyltransferase n=1 Tax=Agrococcus terreus TaxID=574649 RepID=UPI00384DC18C
MRTKTRIALATAGGVAAAAAVVWIAVDGAAGRLALAVLIGACGLALGLLIVRGTRATLRIARRVEQRAEHHHKRAAAWNHHVVTRLDARADARGLQPHAPVASSTVLRENAQALVAAGLFDQDIHVARTGGGWISATDAADHFLRTAAPKGASPTPLLAVAALPEAVRAALRKGDVHPLLDHLRSDAALDAPLGPLFDPRELPGAAASARLHRGGVLGAWMASADDATELPLPASSSAAGATLGQVRAGLIAHAEEVRALAVQPERDVRDWDRAVEAAWIDAVMAGGSEPLPMVSVIMPVKDRAHVIGRAIASVQAQSSTRWQLIVVDDGSADETLEVVEGLAAADSRIMVVQSERAGVSAARNTGLRLATGEYVAFLDSDNAWAPHFLEVMMRGMRRDDLAAAYSASAMHEDDGSITYRALQAGLEQLRLRNHIDLNVLVVQRSLIDRGVRFDETMRRWVDHDFALKVAAITEPKLLPFVGCDYAHSDEAADRITVRESEHWQWVALERHWADWRAAADPVAGRLSVVLLTYNDAVMTAAAVRSVLDDAAASGIDVEVQLIDNGSQLDVGQALLADVAASPLVRYFRLPRNLNFATGCNVGIVRASGEHVLLLNNDTVVRRGALAAMRAALQDDVIGVQPLLVYDDETIQTAGTVFAAADSLPSHLLVGHPKEDALELGDVAFDAATAAALLMRTSDLRALRGFDAIFVNGMEDVDLCLRARRDLGGRFALMPSAVVTHLESKTPGRGARVDENRRIFLARWRGSLPAPQHEILARAGFSIAHVGTDGRDVPGPRPVVVRDPADRRVRWGIRIAAIPGAKGDVWGDTHFAESLRQGLAQLGHRAVVHRHGAHTTPAAGMDDVVLVLRGLDRVRPMPGKRNILWVISHPDKVTIEELQEFDRVFAASVPWAERMTEASGRLVEPLLQATDVARFHTDVPPVPIGASLFVGKHFPTRERAIVRDALVGGVPLAVYGPEWEGHLPAGVLRGQWIDNDRLAGAYRGATRVLADHWPGMAAEGFLQNRLFDAVAAGCRVVSDDVAGAEDAFEGAVRTYRTPQELAALCVDDGAFPDADAMERIAARVREKHSFASRARRLVLAATDDAERAV